MLLIGIIVANVPEGLLATVTVRYYHYDLCIRDTIIWGRYVVRLPLIMNPVTCITSPAWCYACFESSYLHHSLQWAMHVLSQVTCITPCNGLCMF